jgi:molybdopterin-guanine dinucleotide biosynthesis protein A
MALDMKISHLYISPGHNFFGHHGLPPDAHPQIEKTEIQCVAGRGIREDRFFDYKDNYKGQITFFSLELFDEICRQLEVHGKTPGVTRRNVFTTGQDLNELIGTEFEVQGVRFVGIAECSPCYWMDHAIAPGAETLLKGRGGLRARILTDGVLRVEQMNHSAVILAGGRSSRMGRDKAWIELQGQSMLARQIEFARASGAAEVYISGREGTDYSDFACPVLYDDFPDSGPLAGIEKALATTKSSRLLVLAVDLPELSASFLRALAMKGQRKMGAIPRVKGQIEPLLAIYPREARQTAVELLRLREKSVTVFAQHCVQADIAGFVDFPPDAAARFTNWNAPADLFAIR